MNNKPGKKQSNTTKRTIQSNTNGVTFNSIRIKKEPGDFERKEIGDHSKRPLLEKQKHVKQHQTTSNQATRCSKISRSPVVILTKLSNVVLKTLLRETKVRLVKEETDARRDEDNSEGRTCTYSSLHPILQ